MRFALAIYAVVSFAAATSWAAESAEKNSGQADMSSEAGQARWGSQNFHEDVVDEKAQAIRRFKELMESGPVSEEPKAAVTISN